MVTKSPSEQPPHSANKPPQQIPGLIRRALVRSGIQEEEIPDFLMWAFGGEIPETFWKLCITWNEKFGSKLWINVTGMDSAPEMDLFFFKMGKVFVESKTPPQLEHKTIEAGVQKMPSF